MVTILRTALVAVLVLIVSAVPASAGTISLVDGTLSYVAHPAEQDEITVSLIGYSPDFSDSSQPWVHIGFVDAKVTFAPGAGFAEQCTSTSDGYSTTTGCPLALVKRIAINTKDRDDTVTTYVCSNRFKDGTKCNSGQHPHVPRMTVKLGAGNDYFGGGGEDMSKEQIQGGATVHGGPGKDLIIGTMAADKLYGDAGNDSVLGYGGRDLVRGGAGNDTVAGVNQCGFSYCSTTYAGVKDPDKVYGDAGKDRVWGSTGGDKLYGGSGNDTFMYANDRRRDTIDGGPGKDWIKGVDFSRKTYRFSDKLRNVERVNDHRNPLAEFEWKCKKNRCTVTKLKYRPPSTVIVIIL